MHSSKAKASLAYFDGKAKPSRPVLRRTTPDAKRRDARAQRTGPADLLELQRSAGNRAVNRLIQAKLIVGSADDPYEREAERVAAQLGASASTAELPDQRIQALPQTPVVGPEGGEAGDEVERRLAAGRGAGAPLPAETRAVMEDHLGADFSAVRVHTGAEADRLNRQLGAQAFTYGADIYVSEGRYNPRSAEGQRLLAHELTHVVQQTGGARRPTVHGSVRRSESRSIQRLIITSAQLKELAGEPLADKKAFGRVVKRKDTDYKAVLDALDRYKSKIAGVPVYSKIGSTDPFSAPKAEEVLSLLNVLENACREYVRKHSDETLRTPYIQAIIDDIPNERAAIQAILNDPSKYPYTLRDAIQKVRIGGIVDTAVNVMSGAADRQLRETAEERQKEAQTANQKARSEGKPETATARPVPQTVEGLVEEGLGLYASDMDRILAGNGKSPGRAPTAMDWRGNSQTTKIASALSYKVGQDYFRKVLVPALSEVLSIPDELAEVDPAKLSDPSRVNKNADRMKAAYATLMQIFNAQTATQVPIQFAQFCSRLHTLALQKGMSKDEAYLLVSSQVFLRTINPMITTMVSAVPQGHTGKRAMTIVAKLFQDDANNVPHGTKEPFMAVFTDNYRDRIESFVKAIIEFGAKVGY